jgi:uncharacterized protein YbaA (DUF1428 family)
MAPNHDTIADGYVDIYLLPIPERNVDAYGQQATRFGRVTVSTGRSATASFDPRVAQLVDAEPLPDMNRMSFGGFQTFVRA